MNTKDQPDSVRPNILAMKKGRYERRAESGDRGGVNQGGEEGQSGSSSSADHQHPAPPQVPSEEDSSEAWFRPPGEHEEGRRPQYKRTVTQPTAAEVVEHSKTHVPFRSWCRACVMGRGRNDAHRTGAAKKHPYAHPHIVLDYGFLGEAGSRTGDACTLIGSEVTTSMGLAMAVPGKGNSAEWVARRLAKWIEQFGHTKVTVKADNEHSITALIREARKVRGEGTCTLSPRIPGTRGDSVQPRRGRDGQHHEGHDQDDKGCH